MRIVYKKDLQCLDKSGYISEEELFAAIKKFRSGITRNEIKKMIK
jgi:hypothetical protein